MAHISLVLPFALPVPEFAPDLIRALQAPALAALLSRTSDRRFHPLAPKARALPHELWIAHILGLERGLERGPAHAPEPAVAASAMRGFSLEPRDGTWFVVNPVHIQIASTHLMMGDPRQLDLREEEGRALFESARESFTEAGHELAYGSADTWFMRADDWNELHTASPDAAVGMNLTDWMPTGAQARAFRKLQNEVQVTWYTDPANAAREARGQAPVNAFWPWGGASMATEEANRLVANAQGKPKPKPAVITHAVPGWVDALATRRAATAAALVDAIHEPTAEHLLLVAGNAATPAIGADWDGWLRAMQGLEAALFAPLLAAVAKGRVNSLRLVLSHRDGHLELVTTPMAQRKFWRRPTLEALI
jgi:hypothetical protein